MGNLEGGHVWERPSPSLLFNGADVTISVQTVYYIPSYGCSPNSISPIRVQPYAVYVTAHSPRYIAVTSSSSVGLPKFSLVQFFDYFSEPRTELYGSVQFSSRTGSNCIEPSSFLV